MKTVQPHRISVSTLMLYMTIAGLLLSAWRTGLAMRADPTHDMRIVETKIRADLQAHRESVTRLVDAVEERLGTVENRLSKAENQKDVELDALMRQELKHAHCFTAETVARIEFIRGKNGAPYILRALQPYTPKHDVVVFGDENGNDDQRIATTIEGDWVYFEIPSDRPLHRYFNFFLECPHGQLLRSCVAPTKHALLPQDIRLAFRQRPDGTSGYSYELSPSHN